MKRILLMLTLLISVSGFSQNKKIEFPIFMQKKQVTAHTPSNAPNAIKQCLDSIVGEKTKHICSYDSKGNTTLYARFVENELREKIEYAYDDDDNIIMEAFFQWLGVFSYKREYTYTNAIKTMEIEYNWDYLTNDWVLSVKSEYEYDDNGNIASKIDYYYVDNNWVLSVKSEYKYDTNVTLELSYNWTNNEWILNGKAESNYNINGNPILESYYFWVENTWKLYNKMEWKYDINDNVTLWAFYWWDNENNDLKLTQKLEFKYDTKGNLTTCEEYNWGDNYKCEYEYDNHDNLIKCFNWILWDNTWLLNFKTEYQYNFSYSNTDLIIPNITRSSGLRAYAVNFDFGMHNMRIKETEYDEYGNEYYETYYWSSKNIEQGISDNTIQNISVNLYPNPVSNTLYIETNNTNVIPNVKIYSIQGVLMIHTKGNLIDVSSLTSGIYIAEIDGVYRKIVKQ